jgi:ABC-type transporter MlaC component
VVVSGKFLVASSLLPAALLVQVEPAHAQSASVATADPVTTIQTFDRRLRHALQRRYPAWSPEAEAAQMQVHHLVDEMVCVPELARSTLGRHWAEASDRQRGVFLDLFRRILVARVATGQLLAFTPQAPPKLVLRGNGVADVETIVAGQDPRTDSARRASVDYKLRLVGGRWQLVDVVVDDRSVAHEFQQVFDRIIGRESFDGLLDRMRKKAG